MIASLFACLAIGCQTLTAFGLGRPALQALRVELDDALDELVWSLAIGWVLCGQILLALGVVGAWYRPVIGVLSTAGAFWGMSELVQAWFRWEYQRCAKPDAARRGNASEELTPPPAPGLWVGAVGLVLGASLISALAPPTAGDALCYHLELPKRFLAAHRLEFFAHDENVTYPLLTELWYLWGLALEGGVAAQLVHWQAGVGLAAAAVLVGRSVIGRSWSLVAGAIVLLVPAVTNQMTAPLNDLSLALMAVLGWEAWRRASGAEHTRGWRFVAGTLLGGALAIKYLALVWLVAIALATLATMPRRVEAWREALRTMTIIGTLAGCLASPWYLRAAWYRGNPVYPFLAASADGAPAGFPPVKRPLGLHAIDLLSAPWQITFAPQRFGGQGHQLGPLWLMALPSLLFVRRLRGLGTLLVAVAAYGGLWYLMRQNLRFLLVVVPPAAVAASWVLAELARFGKAPRRVAWCAISLALAIGVAAPVSRARRQWAVAVGWESRASYLRRVEPTYQAAELGNALFATCPHPRLLSQDYRAYYFACEVTRESVFRRDTNYAQHRAPHRSLSSTLRARGFTHVLLAEAQGPSGIHYDNTLSQLVDKELAGPGRAELLCLSDYQFLDTDGANRHYRLFWLR